MKLSKRLHAVASLVTPNNRVADVGCDHAYTSIYLVEHNIVPYIIAMDVNQGPIDRARENTIKFGLDKKIEIRKSNGLDQLEVNEVDTVLIAGMGGDLMVQILSKNSEVVSKVHELVLQPQSEVHRVRRMVKEKGFLITKENMIKEDGKYYVMMKAKAIACVEDKDAFALTKEEQFYFGKLLLEQRHPILLEYLEKENKLCERIYKTLISESSDKTVQRQEEILQMMKLIHQGLEHYSLAEEHEPLEE